jgi:hypothetical protein
MEREEAPSRDTATRASLASYFSGRADTFWGIEETKDEGAVFKDSGIPATICSGFAHAIHQQLGGGRVAVCGFFDYDNPDSSIARDAGGHDFAVVDERFIVDPWLVDIAEEKRGVFDLESKGDVARVKALYGQMESWKQARVVGNKLDFALERTQFRPSVVVAEIYNAKRCDVARAEATRSEVVAELDASNPDFAKVLSAGRR